MVCLRYLAAIFVPVCALSASADSNDHWDTQFGVPGAQGTVLGMTCSGSDLYITGSFTSAGESGCIGIAKWDGSNWTGFGSGFAWGSGPVGFSVSVNETGFYIGGIFITNISGIPVQNLGRWDGSSWSEVGGGLAGAVSTTQLKDGDLYVGGIIPTAGGVTVSNITRWDGATWHPLGTGLTGSTNGFTGPSAHALALDANDHLIVVGNFRYAGGVEVNNVARWDGSQWHALGTGVYNGGPDLVVRSVAVLGDQVYVAGVFKSAGGVNATNVARWDGSQWHAMGGGPAGIYNALAIAGTNIYTAGEFTSIGGVAARHVARWNGSTWEPLAPGTAGEILTEVSCLASDGTNLYAGGSFIQAGHAGALAVAKWDGSKWSALAGPKSQGTWLAPIAVEAAGTNVYAGGSGLLIAGGLKPNRIAHWNGSAWDDMGGGVAGGNGRVYSILESGGLVYVGGNFTEAGGVAALNVAYWDGSAWHALASGLNNDVRTLCFHNGQLFAGGSFTARGDGSGSLCGIARWDGGQWIDVPLVTSWRIDNVINALASDGINLYAGGDYFLGWLEFDPVFISVSVDNIGYWDGSHWWPMGTGLDPTVNNLAFVETNLYAGGSFTFSGATPIRRLARWNGNAWLEVGGGIDNGSVGALAVKGTELYVGGSFTSAGGDTNVHHFQRWDGNQWQSLGSGMARISPSSFSIADVAVSGDDVYAVGSFTRAGGRPSAGLARWNETLSFVPPVIRLVNWGRNELGQFHFDVLGLSSGTFTVEAATGPMEWTNVHAGSFPQTNYTDVNSPAIPARTYRVKTP